VRAGHGDREEEWVESQGGYILTVCQSRVQDIGVTILSSRYSGNLHSVCFHVPTVRQHKVRQCT